MKINIIDFRNECLDRLLCQPDSEDIIVSIMLPDNNQPLPLELKSALELYGAHAGGRRMSLNITVEVNKGLNEAQEKRMVQHMYILVRQFYIGKKWLLPPCQLSIFNQNRFTAIACPSENEQSL